MARDDVPQTVGEALVHHWQYLKVRCIYCRRETRLMLTDYPTTARLAGVLSHARCTTPKCKGLTPQIDAHIGFISVSAHEKPIGFGGPPCFQDRNGLRGRAQSDIVPIA